MNNVINFLNENTRKAFIEIIGDMLRKGDFKKDEKGKIRSQGILFRAVNQLKEKPEGYRIKRARWKDIGPIMTMWFLDELKRRGIAVVKQDSFFPEPEESLKSKKPIPIGRIRSIQRGAYGAELRHKGTLGNGY